VQRLFQLNAVRAVVMVDVLNLVSEDCCQFVFTVHEAE
jgi:hypothetical protein